MSEVTWLYPKYIVYISMAKVFHLYNCIPSLDDVTTLDDTSVIPSIDPSNDLIGSVSDNFRLTISFTTFLIDVCLIAMRNFLRQIMYNTGLALPSMSSVHRRPKLTPSIPACLMMLYFRSRIERVKNGAQTKRNSNAVRLKVRDNALFM